MITSLFTDHSERNRVLINKGNHEGDFQEEARAKVVGYVLAHDNLSDQL